MSLFSGRTSVAVALSALAGLSTPAWASTIEVLSLGDSTTFGVGSDTDGLASNASPDDALGGYRFYLDQSLSLSGVDFDFVGSRSDGSGTSGFTDNQHFGISGTEAATDGTGQPSILTGVHNVGVNPTSSDAAFDPAFATPDAVLLNIGLNSLPKSSPFGQSGMSGSERIEFELANAVNEFVDLLDGDGTRTGLVDRLTNNGAAYFANDAHLFVALTTPRTDGQDDDSLERFLTKVQAYTSADYNSRIKQAIEDRQDGTVSTDLAGRVTFVDLYSISLDELDLNALASEFYGSEADPMAALLAAISPEDDSADGGLDYVDWIYDNTGAERFSFDEGEYDNGTLNSIQILTDNEGENNNTVLMPDGLHPSNLGYAIIAQVWDNALTAHYVPEPSALVLFACGGLLLAGGRCSRRP